MNKVHLSNEFALVLQQVDEAGGEDFVTLADTLQVERSRLVHIVTSLRNKGLVVLSQSSPTEMWIRVTTKGRRLTHYIWPESTSLHAS
ncbi:MAG: hypothetical protein JWM37_720 [Candidatus Saccharibacteria bacterium]|nr:hypothetical protein [Candidatus Saccharibacteria bacterium]